MNPKIMVCTIECWTKQNGANTFPQLFKYYPSEYLSNLYIREGTPDSHCCSRYFQISEHRVIQSVFNRRTKTGKEVARSDSNAHEAVLEIAASQKLYNQNRKKRSFIKLMGREFLWLVGHWKTSDLDEYLDSVKPDIIVFEMSSYIHFNRICRYVINRTGAKAVGYFFDDNFTYRQSPGDWKSQCLRFLERNSLKKLSKCCNAFWAITEKTKKEADEYFKVDCSLLTKPIDFPKDSTYKEYLPGVPIKMLYTGNLLIGRFNVISKISDAMKCINEESTKIIMDVYSNTMISEEDKSRLCDSVIMHDSVSQDKISSLQKNADILLFVESMSGTSSQIARLSFSTKLTDYMGSGKCILAVGPDNIAPMEYLAEQNAAICVYTEKDIYENLLKLVNHPELITQMAQKAYICGQKNHSRERIDGVINKTFTKILDKQ